MKLKLQLFGGRGASSSRVGKGSNVREIEGRPVVNETNGIYRYWNIGRNAPNGYVGLIRKGMTGIENTAFMKSKYADEIANLRGDGHSAMGYETIRVLDAQIKKTETALNKVKQEPWQNSSDIRKRRFRLENRLEQMKRVREIRKALNL